MKNERRFDIAILLLVPLMILLVLVPSKDNDTEKREISTLPLPSAIEISKENSISETDRIDEVSIKEITDHSKEIVNTMEKGSINYTSIEQVFGFKKKVFNVYFSTVHEAFVTFNDAQENKISYAINRGKLEIWQRKFCNEGLKEVIVRNGIGGIIGHLDHEDGESQLMALCYVSRKE